MAAWKAGHKKLCAQSDTLLRLAALPRYTFKNFASFMNLPAYKQESGRLRHRKRF